MEMAKSKRNIKAFDGDRYSVWKLRIRSLLTELNVIKVIDKEPPLDFNRKWNKAERIAKSVIIEYLSDSFLSFADSTNTAKEIFQELDAIYERKSLATQLALQKRLLELKLQGDISLMDHFRKFDDLVTELLVSGGELKEFAKVSHLLLTLPSSYDGVITAIETLSEDNLTLAFVKTRLLDHETKIKADNRDTSAKVLNVERDHGIRKNGFNNRKYFKSSNQKEHKGKPFKPYKVKGKCYHCGRRGHMKNDCYYYKRSIQHKNSENRNDAKTAQIAQSSKENISSFAFMTGEYASQDNSYIQFILDSGASDHIVNRGELAEGFIDLPTPMKVLVAKKGEYITITKKGSLNVVSNLGVQGILENVFYCPDIPYNLLSVRRMQEAGMVIIFDHKGVEVRNNNKVIMTAPNNHKSLLLRSEVLYRLNHFQSSLADADNVLKTHSVSGKAYYRRAVALIGLGRNEDALVALCVAAYLNHKLSYAVATSIKQDICALLQRLFVTVLHRSTKDAPPHYGDVAKRKKKRRRQFQLTQNGASDCDEASSSCDEEGIHHICHYLQAQYFHHSLMPKHHKPYITRPKAFSKRTYCMTVAKFIPTPNARFRYLLDRIQQEVQKLRRVHQKPKLLQLSPGQIDVTDFDCVLCCRTLWRPVVTPCGHTYCWICLDRSMDYSTLCPLCKSPLVEQYTTNYSGSTTTIPFSLGKKSATKFLETAMQRFTPQCYEKRRRQEIELEPSVPLFICTTAFPQVPCPLFVYEPRYRLMVRRSIESGERQFGIVQPHTGKSSYSDIGTMLDIRDCVLLGDGCSILSTVGSRRFRIISHDEKDGYETSKVEYIYDEPIPEHRLSEVEHMHNYAFNKAVRWFQSLTNEFKEEIVRSFGSMPNIEVDWTTIDDGPAWAWWIIAILPLNQQLKVDILATTSLEKRLRAIGKTLDYMSNKIEKSQQSCVVVPCEGLPSCQAIECCQQRATSSSTNDERQERNDSTEYIL